MTAGRSGAAVVTGIAVAAAALGIAEIVAIATGPGTAPLVAVGSVVVDSAPEPMTEFGIAVFGVHNRTALQVGILVLLGAAAGGVGLVAARRRWVGLAALGAFATLGIVAAVTRHDATAWAALPTAVGTAAAAAIFLALPALPLQSPQSWSSGPPAGAATDRDRGVEGGPQRRSVLGTAGLVLVGAVVAGLGGRQLSTRRGVAAAREELTLPEPVDPAPQVPSGADLRLPDLASYVTGNDSFYRIDTALVVPRLEPADWTLRIHGRVRHSFTITFEELLGREMLERFITLACVSNPVGGDLIGNARWLGVPVAELLAEADPLPGADQVVSRSVDGWTCGTPIEVLTDGRDALLAIAMNGEPLPPEHGFPVRMVVPGLYGYVSACKWIAEIELSSFDDYDAYWVPRGWAPRAPIKTQSRIDTPRGRAAAGEVVVAGVAWAQHRGIERVEVRVDGGPWHEATLADTISSDTWRQWSWAWPATPGEHDVTVRATDSTGETQPQEPRPVAPDGATGWHTVRVEVS